MSKAEEKALERFPVHKCFRRYDGIISSDDPYDANLHERYIFQLGYEQAEKDFGWVSVKDRLPETSEYVLTCINDFGVPQCVGLSFYSDGRWWEDLTTEEEGAIEYWMPIPGFSKTD